MSAACRLNGTASGVLNKKFLLIILYPLAGVVKFIEKDKTIFQMPSAYELLAVVFRKFTHVPNRLRPELRLGFELFPRVV